MKTGQLYLTGFMGTSLLVFDGTGYDNLCTEKQYGDFEIHDQGKKQCNDSF